MNTAKKGLPWTEKENDYLKLAYRVFPVKQIAEDLGRTPGAIQARAIKLNITKPRKSWTQKEIDYVILEYPLGTDITEMANFLKRDKTVVTTKANQLGLERPEAWLECEDTFLIEERKKGTPYKDIASKLDKSIQNCYSRFYRLKKKGGL